MNHLSSQLTGPPTFKSATCTSGYVSARLCARFRWLAFTRESEKTNGRGSCGRRELVMRSEGWEDAGRDVRIGRAQWEVVYNAMVVVWKDVSTDLKRKEENGP